MRPYLSFLVDWSIPTNNEIFVHDREPEVKELKQVNRFLQLCRHPFLFKRQYYENQHDPTGLDRK